MGKSFDGVTTCDECGRVIPNGAEKVYLSSLDRLGPVFCSCGCRDKYKQRQNELAAAAKAAKEAEIARKEAKKEAKKAAAAKKLEDSKVTSDESFAKISHLCLVAGLAGVHRFAVGKFISGILMPATVVFGIAMAIANREPSMLLICAADVVWWLFDLATIKAKKFTDKYGYTVRD